MLKFIAALIVIGFSQNVYAKSFFVPETFNPNDSEIDFLSVRDRHVETASCKARVLPSVEEMLTQVKLLGKADVPKTIKAGGFVFKSESAKLVRAFADLKVPATGACESVLCAVKAAWGDELGLKILYLKVKYGFNASEFAYKESARFTVAELNDVILSAQDMPAIFVPFSNNKQLTHFTRGVNYGDKKDQTIVVAISSMQVYDEWSRANSNARRGALYHEIGHNVAIRLNYLDQKPVWSALHGCKVSRYGDTDIMEDFAETFTMYRYRSADLKTMCPEKYEFFKTKVYQGLEYDSVAHCTRTSQSVIDSAVAALSAAPYFMNLVNDQLASSLQVAKSECKDTSSSEKLNACLQKVAVRVMSASLSQRSENKAFSATLTNLYAMEEVMNVALRKAIIDRGITPSDIGIVTDDQITYKGSTRDQLWAGIFSNPTPSKLEGYSESWAGYSAKGVDLAVDFSGEVPYGSIIMSGARGATFVAVETVDKQKKLVSDFIRKANAVAGKSL